MAITLVQSKSASGNSGTTASVTGLAATTAGTLLVMLVSAAKNPGDVDFTPPAGWVQAGGTVHNDVFISISTAVYYYAGNPGGITSVSTTLSGAVSAWHIYVMEFSGVATTSPLDGSAAREQDHTTTPSSGAITTTADGDLLIGWSEMDNSAGTYTLTQPDGWTVLAQQDDLGGWTSSFPAYVVAGTAGSEDYQPGKTNSVNTTDGTFTLVAFKAATGGGTAQSGSAAVSASATAGLSGSVAYAASASPSAASTAGLDAAVAYAGSAAVSGGATALFSPGLIFPLSAAASASGSASLTGLLTLFARMIASGQAIVLTTASLNLAGSASAKGSATAALDGTGGSTPIGYGPDRVPVALVVLLTSETALVVFQSAPTGVVA